MAFGLGVLGLAPGDFWALTLREFDAILRGRVSGAGVQGLSRGELDQLMTAFPDA